MKIALVQQHASLDKRDNLARGLAEPVAAGLVSDSGAGSRARCGSMWSHRFASMY